MDKSKLRLFCNIFNLSEEYLLEILSKARKSINNLFIIKSYNDEVCLQVTFISCTDNEGYFDSNKKLVSDFYQFDVYYNPDILESFNSKTDLSDLDILTLSNDYYKTLKKEKLSELCKLFNLENISLKNTLTNFPISKILIYNENSICLKVSSYFSPPDMYYDENGELSSQYINFEIYIDNGKILDNFMCKENLSDLKIIDIAIFFYNTLENFKNENLTEEEISLILEKYEIIENLKRRNCLC